MKKVIFIASTGGHLQELLQLRPLIKKYNGYVITEKTKSTLGLQVEFKDHIQYLVFGSKSHISYAWKFPWNIVKSSYLFLKIRPNVIISTGAHTSVPMCYIAKVFRCKIIYIETFANMHTKSVSGKLVYPIADLFLVQWESMLELYPKAKYVGGVF